MKVQSLKRCLKAIKVEKTQFHIFIHSTASENLMNLQEPWETLSHTVLCTLGSHDPHSLKS